MITKIPQQMLRLEGQYNQPAVVIRDHKMQASQVSDIVQTEVVAGRFDANSGTLVLTFFDGTQKTIEGFPTESKIPVGPTGPSGKNGEDGRPGQKGRNGMPGAPGCDGPIGLVGIMGLRGDEGRPGQQGPVGPEGAQGDIGQQGMPGNTGPRGQRGPKGQIGDKGPRGRIGPAAPEQILNIVVSTSEPQNKVHGMLWVNPEPAPEPTPPQYREPGTQEEFLHGKLVCSEDSPYWNVVPETSEMDKRRIVEAYKQHPWNHGRCPEHYVNGSDGWTFWQEELKTSSIDDVVSKIGSSDVPESVQLGIVKTICEDAAIEKYGAGGFASFEYIPFSGNRCRVTF